MSDYSQICLYYVKGMCVYCNHAAAIFEKMEEEMKIKNMPICIQKRTIETIRRREKDLEGKAK